MFYVVCGILVASLFPLAVYCLVVALVYSRRHPTLTSGAWEFAGALFATAGFLLFAGPCILSGLHARWRDMVQTGSVQDLVVPSSRWGVLWLVVWTAYFLAVVGGSAFLLWRRRRLTAIFNVEVPALEEALGRALDRLGLTWLRVGDRVLAGGPSGRAPAKGEPATANAQRDAGRPLAGPDGEGFVEPTHEVLVIDPFPALRHVTLRWREAGETIRRDVVAELAKELREVESPDNAVAGWMLTLSGCLFAAVIFISLALIAIIVLARR